jgi:hypothetical protein
MLTGAESGLAAAVAICGKVSNKLGETYADWIFGTVQPKFAHHVLSSGRSSTIAEATVCACHGRSQVPARWGRCLVSITSIVALE